MGAECREILRSLDNPTTMGIILTFTTLIHMPTTKLEAIPKWGTLTWLETARGILTLQLR